ncbi:Rne/Rng family ribonuclease [Frankia sp. AgKG'84/4]
MTTPEAAPATGDAEPAADSPPPTRRRTRATGTAKAPSSRASRAKSGGAVVAAVEPEPVDAATAVSVTTDPVPDSGAVADTAGAAPVDPASGSAAADTGQSEAPQRRTRSRRAVRGAAPADPAPTNETTPGADAVGEVSAVAAVTEPATPPAEEAPRPRRTRARRATSGPVSAPTSPDADSGTPAVEQPEAAPTVASVPAEPAASATAPDGESPPAPRTRARGTRRRATSAKAASDASTGDVAPEPQPVVAESTTPAPATSDVAAFDPVPAAPGSINAGHEPAADQDDATDQPVAPGAAAAEAVVEAAAPASDAGTAGTAVAADGDAVSAPAGGRSRTRTRRVAAPTWTGVGEETPAAHPGARRPVAMVTFQAPVPAAAEPRWTRPGSEPDHQDDEVVDVDAADEQPVDAAPEDAPVSATDSAVKELAAEDDGEFDEDDEGGGASGSTRRRRRGRRGRGRARGDEDGSELSADGDAPADADADDWSADADPTAETAGGGDATDPDNEAGADSDADSDADGDSDADDDRGGNSRRRRRRRRRTGGDEPAVVDDPPNTVVHVRETRRDEDLVRGLSGSTRLEAKRQRRREGRDSGRRRPPIVTEAEFLARREAVERRMVVRHAGDRTQIAVLEDGVLVEHFVTRASSTSYAGNVYLGRVQNVLASMEAAFVDIGKGRNAVLYAGEVNYDASGLDGRPRKIEQVLKSGQSVLVQVSKDPIGHKGARLTSQISLPGRYLVYVPDGQNAGISRKLPDTERARLKSILKKITPEDGGVIVRTAAEGASEAELSRDIERLAAQWEDIQRRSKKASAPSLLSGEPDLVVRVIRDIFNEDFTELVVQGSGEAQTIEEYIDAVAPDLRPRIRRYAGTGDVFADYRVDEQLAKALDRKVWLPSGGSLVIDRTEAMTVVDVNTGKFTGKGGNLEETVTKNNLEAAEEIVRQLRLRDIGGIIVIDFIDMVLESNRELVLRRLTECLGRDRTRHQVAEVTSLGLVQMTRKRVGQGLLEAYSEPCIHCNGRGVVIHLNGNAAANGNGGHNGHVHPVPAAVVAGGNGQSEPATGGATPSGSSRRSRGAATRSAGGPTPAVASSEDAVAEPAGTAVATEAPAAVESVADGVSGPVDVVAASTTLSGEQQPAAAENGHSSADTGEQATPVYANSDDPDSVAVVVDGAAEAAKPAKGRRRRASRPVSKPSAEAPLEPVASPAESTSG